MQIIKNLIIDQFEYENKALEQSALYNDWVFWKFRMNDLRLTGKIVFKNSQVGNLIFRYIRNKVKLEFIQQGIAPGDGGF